MDTLRHGFFCAFAIAMLAACSSNVSLGPPPDAGAPPTDDASLPDASLADSALGDDAATPPDDADVPLPSSCPCGFCFEHRADPGYTDLWVRTPTDIWLVAGRRRVEHFDGVSYTDIPLPELDSDLESILALEGGTSETPFLALARQRPTGRGRVHELHRWDGSGWERITLPELLRQSLNGSLLIAPTRDGQLYATLRHGNYEPAAASVFHFDGDAWSEHTFEGEWHVYGLSARGDRAFLTLYEEDYVVSLFENTGDGWNGFPAPYYDPSWGHQVPRIAIGERIYAFSGFVHVWDPTDSTWRIVDVPRGVDAGGYGSAHWIITNDSAFRSTGPEDPLALEAHTLPFAADAVSFPTDGPAWIAGSGLAYWNGARWTSVLERPRLYNFLTGYNATSVWGTSADDYWLVDRRTATATHVHDHISERVRVDPFFLFTSVHGLDDGDVFLHSSNRVYRLSGSEILERHAIAGRSVRGAGRLWGTDEDHLWMSTSEGVLRYRDGAFFAELTPNPEQWLGTRTFIGGQSEDDVWAVSDSGAVYHYDGAAWTEMPSVPVFPSNVYEAYFGESGVWLLAQHHDSLHVWSFRSGSWERTELAEPGDDLVGDLFGRGDEVWAVTEDRVIFRRQDDDTWSRDDSCRGADALAGITFATGWFPPDGGPPKILGESGNVLVEQEPE